MILTQADWEFVDLDFLYFICLSCNSGGHPANVSLHLCSTSSCVASQKCCNFNYQWPMGAWVGSASPVPEHALLHILVDKHTVEGAGKNFMDFFSSPPSPIQHPRIVWACAPGQRAAQAYTTLSSELQVSAGHRGEQLIIWPLGSTRSSLGLEQ